MGFCKMKTKYLLALPITFLFVACGTEQSSVVYKSEVAKSDLLNNADLTGTSLKVDPVDLPSMSA